MSDKKREAAVKNLEKAREARKVLAAARKEGKEENVIVIKKKKIPKGTPSPRDSDGEEPEQPDPFIDTVTQKEEKAKNISAIKEDITSIKAYLEGMRLEKEQKRAKKAEKKKAEKKAVKEETPQPPVVSALPVVKPSPNDFINNLKF